MGHPWPLFDLRLRTPRLELRLPTDDDLIALMRVARAGLHDPAERRFLTRWNLLPTPAFERSFLTYHWRQRGAWRPDEWVLNFAVVFEGEPVGIQAVMGRQFAVRRVVDTGSWLGAPQQGRGLGTEMRAAVLWLAFDGLGAESAQSGYLEGSAASQRISDKLGYVPNGIETLALDGAQAIEYRVRVTRDTWRRDLVPVLIEGLEPCLPLFGAAPLAPNDWPAP